MYSVYLMKKGHNGHVYKIGETNDITRRTRQLKEAGYYRIASFDLASTKAESLLVEAIVRWKLSRIYKHQPLDRFITNAKTPEVLANFTEAVAMATKLLNE